MSRLLHRASNGKLDYFNLPLVQRSAAIFTVSTSTATGTSTRRRLRIHAGGDLICYGRRIDDTLMAHGSYAASLDGTAKPDTGSVARQLDSL
jgi:hypothetical protein